MPLLIDELRISDLYYAGPRRVLRSVREPEFAMPVGDIDNLTGGGVYATNNTESVQAHCPEFYVALKPMEVETLMVARIGMDSAPADGYLLCAGPRRRRIWQEDECAYCSSLRG